MDVQPRSRKVALLPQEHGQFPLYFSLTEAASVCSMIVDASHEADWLLLKTSVSIRRTPHCEALTWRRKINSRNQLRRVLLDRYGVCVTGAAILIEKVHLPSWILSYFEVSERMSRQPGLRCILTKEELLMS